MSLRRQVASGLRGLFRKDRVEEELGDELRSYFDASVEARMASGLSREAAMRAARLEMGTVEAIKDEVRDAGWEWHLETLLQDARHGLRTLVRAPGFTVVALLTIALAIGANTAIFSVVNAVLLRTLPYTEPDRLVRVYLVNPAQDITDGRLSVPEVDDWRGLTRALSSLAGTIAVPMILTGQGEPTEHETAVVVGDLFGTLGVTPLIGRVLTGDDIRQAVPRAVISERMWTTRFGRDPRILGRTLVMGSRPYTIVGVIPSGFRYPESEVDFWLPQSVLPDDMLGPRVRSQRVYEGIACLAPGVTLEQAQDDVNRVAAQLAAAYPDTNRGWSAARIVPLRTTIVGEVGTALLVVFSVAGVILLIACANLANLQLARGTARRREVATRLALGARPARILRQLLTESLVLGLLGGLLGVAVGLWGLQTLLALSAGTLPRMEDVRLDARVMAFGLLLAILTALLFGILPALRAARTDPQQRVREGRGTVGDGGRLRNGLVVAHLALAVVLVVGGTLMARSFLALRGVDPGFDPDKVLAVTMQYNLPSSSGDLAAHLLQRRQEILERIAALPGVVAAGSITSLPLDAECRDTLVFTKADGTPPPGEAPFQAANCIVSPGYIKAMRIPLLRGRPLPEAWPEGAPFPFLVSEAAARRFWPGQDPIGQIVRANYGGRAVVVGIVGDVRQNGLAADPPPVVYFNQRTAPRVLTTIVARTSGDPMLLSEPIRAAVRQVDPNQPIRRITTLADVMSESIARDRFFTLLFGLFGGLALVLAAVGVYGVLAYSVGQRTREIGVRIALGAQVADLLQLVVGDGMRLVLAGVALGTVVALLTARVLSSQLHGIHATDPVAFVLATGVLTAVALLACWVPARRATRIHATDALRAE